MIFVFKFSFVCVCVFLYLNFQHWTQQTVQEVQDSDLGLDPVIIVRDNGHGDELMDLRSFLGRTDKS